MYLFSELINFFLIVNEVGGKCLLNLKPKYGQGKTYKWMMMRKKQTWECNK